MSSTLIEERDQAQNDVRNFLDVMCKTVVEKSEGIRSQDRPEKRLRNFEEDGSARGEFSEDNRKLVAAAKKSSHLFMDELFKQTIVQYKDHHTLSVRLVAKIQSRFRGYLQRIIHKMETMNHKILVENEKAIQRVKAKIIAKVDEKRKSTK